MVGLKSWTSADRLVNKSSFLLTVDYLPSNYLSSLSDALSSSTFGQFCLAPITMGEVGQPVDHFDILHKKLAGTFPDES